jgi:uncharacterized protein YjdB
MKRIFQTLLILSMLVIAVCSCKKDKDFIPISKVILNKATVTIPVGGTIELRASIYPNDATNKTIKWSSDNTSIATTSRNGLITGVAPGITIIRVTDESGVVHYTDCAISVHEAVVPVVGVSIGKSETTISVNGVETLNHTVSPQNATNKNVMWSSNDTSVVTVDGNGKITGISAGSATVTLTSEDGGFTSSCVITVSNETIAVTGVSLNKTALTVSVNGTEQLSATVAPENATDKNVTWSSNASDIVTVNAEGLITGIAVGTATVTATSEDGGFTASCVITVEEAAIPVTDLSLNKTVFTVSVNGTEQLVATVVPTNATNKNVTWSSNATNVATVNNEGLITGISAGTATITVTSEDGGFTASCVITVNEATIPVTGVALNKTAINMYIGDVEQLLATVVPDNAANTGITWSSSATTVVTIGDDGVVTGVSAGTATVTATSDDGEFMATCTVTVEDETGDVTSTGWSAPDAKKYEYSMTYMTQVAFRGTLSTDVNTEVAAFVGNELRGYAKLVHEPRLNVYLVHLIIYSNSSGSETVILKAYNPEKQRIYENCKEFTFHGNTSLGLASEILNCMP